MINHILTYYKNKLKENLEKEFNYPEGIVMIAPIGKEQENDSPDKLVISLLSLERETTRGIIPGRRPIAPGNYGIGTPPLHLNLNIIIAAVFNDKRYTESLAVLSSALLFIQSNPVLILPGGLQYTIEVVSPSIQDLSNIWTCLGGHYYPSVVCKIRHLTLDAGEIKRISGKAQQPEINL